MNNLIPAHLAGSAGNYSLRTGRDGCATRIGQAEQDLESAPDVCGPGGDMRKLLAAVAEVEKARGCKIWCIVHCNRGHICRPTMSSIIKNRHDIRSGNKIEILLHSSGGHPEIAYSALTFFRRRFKEVNIIVPVLAKSAATLMCFGADHIYMGELAHLGPIDIQIDDQFERGDKSFSPLDEFKSIEFLRDLSIEWVNRCARQIQTEYGVSFKQGLADSVALTTGLMGPVLGKIDPIKMGGYRRAIAIIEEYGKRMLASVGNENGSKIIKQMAWEYPSHDFCINFDEARDLQLPVERLPESQDEILTSALLNIEAGDYHGFIPIHEPEKPTTAKEKVPTKPRSEEKMGHKKRIQA